MKKGLSPFMSLILVVVISVAGMVLVLRMGEPLMNKTEDFSEFSESRDAMNRINSAIKDVSYEGNGSSRKISLNSREGEYRVSASGDSVTYKMESKYELFSTGMSKREGDLYIDFYENNTLKLILNSTNIDITTTERWGTGSYNILIKNEGYSGGKTRISFTLL
ncbi:MAG: hypothetical protein JSV92_05260 [archaeon]|nr:MAG: hypothetical protein JSV92_05260 [archaeon]